MKRQDDVHHYLRPNKDRAITEESYAHYHEVTFKKVPTAEEYEEDFERKMDYLAFFGYGVMFTAVAFVCYLRYTGVL